MDLSIIIVSWNVREKLKENLATLYQSQGDFNFEIIVVDNNSHDDSVAMIKKEFSQVKIIANNENLGFAQANNQAIKITQGDFVLLLNPDMRVKIETLNNMLKWMRENKQADLAGCKLINEKGEIVKHVRCFPQFSDQLIIVLKLPHFFLHILDNYLRVDFNYNEAAVVDSVRGGFMMIKKETIDKIGLLDERYFLWFEEVDYCRRIKKAGGQVWYTPAAECIDYVGQSFNQVERLTKQKYFRDSMLKYFKKWQPFWQYWLLWLAWWPGLMIASIGEILKIQGKGKT